MFSVEKSDIMKKQDGEGFLERSGCRMDKEKNKTSPQDAEKKEQEKKEMDDYYKKVRERLREQLNLDDNKTKPDYMKIAKQMEKYGIYASDQKVRAMFDKNNGRVIPAAELAALCEILGLRIGDICAPLKKPAESSESFTWDKDGEKKALRGVSALSDVHYIDHEYYCCYFKTKEYSTFALGGKKPAEGIPLKLVRLKIENEGGVSWATLTDDDRFMMKGRVFLIERNRQIFCRLMDEKGLRLIDLMLPYRNYSVDKMWYRTAGMLTISYNREERPLFQKMAIFRKQPDLSRPEIESIVRGILTLDSREIMIKEDDFEALIGEDAAFADLKAISAPKSYYSFRESDFSNTDLSWDTKDGLRRILRLRQMSELASHEIVSDSEDMEKFLKDLQLVNFRL